MPHFVDCFSRNYLDSQDELIPGRFIELYLHRPFLPPPPVRPHVTIPGCEQTPGVGAPLDPLRGPWTMV